MLQGRPQWLSQRKRADPAAAYNRRVNRALAGQRRRSLHVARPHAPRATDPLAYFNDTDERFWRLFRRWREIQIRRARPGEPLRLVWFDFDLFLLEVCCSIREADGPANHCGWCSISWRWWMGYTPVSRVEIARQFRAMRRDLNAQTSRERYCPMVLQ